MVVYSTDDVTDTRGMVSILFYIVSYGAECSLGGSYVVIYVCFLVALRQDLNSGGYLA